MQPGHLNKAHLLSTSDVSLYDRYSFTIFSYLRLHTASCEDAEDLMLEVFVAHLNAPNCRYELINRPVPVLRDYAIVSGMDGTGAKAPGAC